MKTQPRNRSAANDRGKETANLRRCALSRGNRRRVGPYVLQRRPNTPGIASSGTDKTVAARRWTHKLIAENKDVVNGIFESRSPDGSTPRPRRNPHQSFVIPANPLLDRVSHIAPAILREISGYRSSATLFVGKYVPSNCRHFAPPAKVPAIIVDHTQ